jgi:hypothetical protein
LYDNSCAQGKIEGDGEEVNVFKGKDIYPNKKVSKSQKVGGA